MNMQIQVEQGGIFINNVLILLATDDVIHVVADSDAKRAEVYCSYIEGNVVSIDLQRGEDTLNARSGARTLITLTEPFGEWPHMRVLTEVSRYAITIMIARTARPGVERAEHPADWFAPWEPKPMLNDDPDGSA
jgi:hypothetical protein